LAGYAFGIAAVLGLLSLGLIETNYNDLWSMLRQWNRRRQFRDTSGDSSFDKPVRTSVFSRTPIDGEQNSQIRERILELRSRISDAMNSRLAPEAAALYLELLKIDDAQILPRQLQLDVANQLMSEGQWQLSADAYQKYLSQYSHFGYAEQVHLMLGLLYGRYLNRFPEALKHLNMAKDHLTDPGQKNLCLQEIERLNHLV